jgi:hypothetical protein
MHAEYEKLPYYPLIDRLRIRITVIALFVTSMPYFSKCRRAVIGLLRRAHILYSSPAAETTGEIPKHYPVKMDPVAASLGYLQFSRIQEIEVIRKKLAEKYFQLLSGIDGLRLYHSTLYDMVRFPVLVVSNDAESVALKIRRRVSLETGVETGDWFNDVVHPKGGYRFDYNQGQCPVGEYVSARMFNLPMNSMVLPDDDQLQHIRTIILQELSAQQVSGQNSGMAGINR